MLVLVAAAIASVAAAGAQEEPGGIFRIFRIFPKDPRRSRVGGGDRSLPPDVCISGGSLKQHFNVS